MTIDRETIHELCTEVVFERGQQYCDEGRIQQIDRVGDIVTARVHGTDRYEVRVDLASEDLDPHCTCPYRGAGECKHVVAVLLTVAGEEPGDQATRIDSLLGDIPPRDLREFLRDELARRPEMRDRFLATFGGNHTRTAEEYRETVEQLYDEATDDYPVVTEAIDFTRLTDQAERYRERGEYLQAAAVYRALSDGIAENDSLVDAAYDHFAQTFQAALDGYVECVLAADVDDEAFDEHLGYLARQRDEVVDYLAERYWAAIDELESRR